MARDKQCGNVATGTPAKKAKLPETKHLSSVRLMEIFLLEFRQLHKMSMTEDYEKWSEQMHQVTFWKNTIIDRMDK